MGRHSYGQVEDQPARSLWLVALPLANGSPEYDAGGAYWGHVPGNPVWCLFSCESDDECGKLCRYDRAANKEQAMEAFGVSPEQLSSNPQPRYVQTPDLFLDLSSGCSELCVTPLVKAFENREDYDSLMLSAQDYCLPGPDSHYSWRYAKETVANWRFGDNLVAKLKDYFEEMGFDVAELDDEDLRGMLLQEVAGEYVQWERHGEDSDSFSEWLNQEDRSGRLIAGDDDEYYMYIGS